MSVLIYKIPKCYLKLDLVVLVIFQVLLLIGCLKPCGIYERF